MKKLIGVLAVVLAIGLICASSYAALEDGLVGYWSFDTGTAKDDSGNGNKGIIHGAPKAVGGKVGMAFDFNGETDGVEIPSNSTVELPNALTAACWVFPRAPRDAAGNDVAGVFWKGNKIGWGLSYNWRIATSGDAGLTWGSCGAGTEGYFSTSNCFVDGLNTWYHVALVEDGSEGRAYVNGVVQTDADVTMGDMHRPGAPYNTWPDEPVRIGWSQGRGGDVATLVYFDGIIDEVVLYDRALSATEVGQLMDVGINGTTAVEPVDKLATTWSRIKAD
jgi:hypothetical protein